MLSFYFMKNSLSKTFHLTRSTYQRVLTSWDQRVDWQCGKRVKNVTASVYRRRAAFCFERARCVDDKKSIGRHELTQIPDRKCLRSTSCLTNFFLYSLPHTERVQGERKREREFKKQNTPQKTRKRRRDKLI
jgi:hypothetical protein